MLETDLRTNYRWQAERVRNSIIWDQLIRNPKFIRKSTDFINRGEINVIKLPNDKFEIEILFSIKRLILLTTGIGLVGIIYGIILNNVNAEYDRGNHMIIGGIIISIISFIGNYFIYKVFIKTALNNSIDRIQKKLKTEPNNGEYA